MCYNVSVCLSVCLVARCFCWSVRAALLSSPPLSTCPSVSRSQSNGWSTSTVLPRCLPVVHLRDLILICDCLTLPPDAAGQPKLIVSLLLAVSRSESSCINIVRDFCFSCSSWAFSACSALTLLVGRQKEHTHTHTHARTHTHTQTHIQPFNGPFSGTTQVSRYQKGRTNLDFTEAKDSEWQWHQLDQMQVRTLL